LNYKSFKRYFFVQRKQILFEKKKKKRKKERKKKRGDLNEYRSCILKYSSYKILPVESPNEKLTPRPFCFLTSSATEVVMSLQSLMANTLHIKGCVSYSNTDTHCNVTTPSCLTFI
jgi:hypothetical protein